MEIEEALRNLVQRKYHFIERKLKKYELVKGQADLLLLIKDNDGITQNELATLLKIKDSSMSVRLNKLEKLNYITREIDKDNLKKKRVYITTVGKSVCGQCRRIVREFEEMMYHGFTKKERQQLENGMEKINHNINMKS